MEFIVKTDLEAFPDVIETNADELMSELTEKLEKYNSLVVTPESIASAKNDKAALNKLRSALEERRKEIKRQCLAPYEQFEVKYKKLLALIDAPIKSIDTQIRLFDEMEVSEKRAHLQGYFEQQVCRTEGTFRIEFDKILNPKWKNKTMKETTLEREISETVSRIQAEAKTLTEEYQNGPHLTAVLDRYAQNYDMMDALAIKYGNSPAQLVVGKSALEKRASRCKLYKGFEAGIIVRGKNGTEWRTGAYLTKDEELVGGWARVYVDGFEKPVETAVSLHEYSTGKSNWASKPATMIRKTAKSQALREAFPEEMQGMDESEGIAFDETLSETPVEIESEPVAEDVPHLDANSFETLLTGQEDGTQDPV